MKQPRVPEFHKKESTNHYLLRLILFLKDFTLSVWDELNRQGKEIEDLKNMADKGSEING